MSIPFIQLDSSDAGSTWNRPARPVRLMLTCDGSTGIATLMSRDGSLQRTWPSPIAALAWLGSAAAREYEWIGFLSYDLGRCFENLPVGAMDDLKIPLFVFTAHDSHTEALLSSEIAISSGLASSRDTPGEDRGEGSSLHSKCALPEEPSPNPLPKYRERGMRRVDDHADVKSTFTRPQYESAVELAIKYIAAGDVFQVNLSQRFSLPMTDTPQAIYRRLREQSPAAFGGLLDFGDFALICNSPELFLKVTPDRHVITRPIKGTRPLGPGMKEQLLHSVKDQAELNMIVDLERNDLGRVCQIGSVRVTEPRTIESHPTVYHGVATIEGTLREEITFLDLLRATFPGGSITGAPKIRAMEIIEQIESVRRGPYCGAIGYIARDGTIEFNIAIRTMIAKDGIIHIPVGGGIVADSNPRDEYEETLVKARAMFAAVGVPPQAVEPLGKR